MSLACVVGIPSFLAVCGATPLGSLDQCVWVKTCGRPYGADHLSQFGGPSFQVRWEYRTVLGVWAGSKTVKETRG